MKEKFLDIRISLAGYSFMLILILVTAGDV